MYIYKLLSGMTRLLAEDEGLGLGTPNQDNGPLVTPPVKTFEHDDQGRFLPVEKEEASTETKVEPVIGADGKPTIAKVEEQKPQVLTEEVIARIAKSIQPATPPAPRPQETQQEYQARLEKLKQETFHYTPTRAEIGEMLGVDNPTDKQVAAFSNALNMIARHGFGMGKYYADQAMKDRISAIEAHVERTVAPLRQAYERQEGQRLADEFYNKFPGLKPYQNVVNAAAQLVNPKNADGSQKNWDQNTAEIVDNAHKILTDAGHKINKADLAKEISSAASSNGGSNGNRTQSQATRSTVPKPTQMDSGAGRCKGSEQPSGGNKPTPFLMPED